MKTRIFGAKRQREQTLGGRASRTALFILAFCMLFINQCTPSKIAIKLDMPEIKTEVKDGKEVKLNVALVFQEERTSAANDFFKILQTVNYINLISSKEAKKVILNNYRSTNYLFKLVESDKYRDLTKLHNKGFDYLILYKENTVYLSATGKLYLDYYIYLIDLTKYKVVTFYYDDEVWLQPNPDPLNTRSKIIIKKRFYKHISKAFPEAYRQKVGIAKRRLP